MQDGTLLRHLSISLILRTIFLLFSPLAPLSSNSSSPTQRLWCVFRKTAVVWFAPSSLFSICQPVLKPQLHTTVLAEPKNGTGVCSTFTTKQACPKRQGLIRRHQNLSYIQHLTSMVLCYLLSALHNVQCTYPHCGVLQGRQQTTVAGPLLRFWLRIGLDKSLQDWILTKVRKRLLRQNWTNLYINWWGNT